MVVKNGEMNIQKQTVKDLLICLEEEIMELKSFVSGWIIGMAVFIAGFAVCFI